MKVVIAAAGTAGHINPAISIANKIMQEEPDSKIIFIGTSRGLENDLVPRAGYELKTIEAYGLSKKISIDNFKKMCKTLIGLRQAQKIIKEFKPDILIGTGGYICGTTATAAKKYNVPVVIHESNAFPGKAVQMLSGKADKILVSFEETKQRLPKCKEVVFTGCPVSIKKLDLGINERTKIINSLGLNVTKPIILVFGGSQGAQKINETLIDIINTKKNKNYQIIWSTGQKQFDIIKQELEKLNLNIEHIDNCKILPYIYNMEEVENIADMVVARSGAMTITEIADLGKPSILIPLPNVSNNHQMYNAKVLEKAGAATIIENNELNSDLLNSEIERIILDKNKFIEMGINATKVSISNVEEKIYNQIKEQVERKK